MSASRYHADNVVQKSSKMDWYKGFQVKRRLDNGTLEIVTGHTLIDAFDKVLTLPERNVNKPFRLAQHNCHTYLFVSKNFSHETNF